MTRKHFIAIAATIKADVDARDAEIERMLASGSYGSEDVAYEAHALEAVMCTARKLATTFASFNPNFDRQRFLHACGIDRPTEPEPEPAFRIVSVAMYDAATDTLERVA
jgi:hypothetical protein